MTSTTPRPLAIYVWLVPSEEVLDQPGSWRIRKWDTEPFPEANYTLSVWDGAIEAAAAACEGLFADHYDHSQRKVGALECAKAIRALKREQPF